MATFEQSISILGQALNMRTQRHQVLASNIANADTPSYKARDFSFESAMKNATAGRGEMGDVAMIKAAGGHFQGANGSGSTALKFRAESQSSADGNTVDMDIERTEITENALQYQVLTQLIGDKFKSYRMALSNTNS